MLAGELYFAADPELVGLRKNAARLTRLYNATTEEEGDLRSRLLQELFGTLGEKATIEPPFRCDYGLNIHSGDRLYLNYNCIILDCCEVRIGNDVMLGPNVQLYTAYHPTDPHIRLMGLELAAPIEIGDNVSSPRISRLTLWLWEILVELSGNSTQKALKPVFGQQPHRTDRFHQSLTFA